MASAELSAHPPRKKGRDGLAVLLFLLPTLVLFGAFILLPLCQIFIFSLFRYEVFGGQMTFVGLTHFFRLVGDNVFLTALINNVLIAVLSVVLQVGLGLVLAAMLDRGVRRFKGTYRTIIFAPILISTAAIGLLWGLFLDPNIGPFKDWVRLFGFEAPRNGILGEPDLAIYAVIGVGAWQYTGFMMVILLAGMQSISEDIYAAGRMDSCTGLRAFFHITLPLVRPVILTCILLTVIGAFKVFDLVYVLTNGGPGTATEVLASYIFRNAFEFGKIGYANALSVIFLCLAFLFGLVQFRMLRK